MEGMESQLLDEAFFQLQCLGCPPARLLLWGELWIFNDVLKLRDYIDSIFFWHSLHHTNIVLKLKWSLIKCPYMQKKFDTFRWDTWAYHPHDHLDSQPWHWAGLICTPRSLIIYIVVIYGINFTKHALRRYVVALWIYIYIYLHIRLYIKINECMHAHAYNIFFIIYIYLYLSRHPDRRLSSTCWNTSQDAVISRGACDWQGSKLAATTWITKVLASHGCISPTQWTSQVPLAFGPMVDDYWEFVGVVSPEFRDFMI